MSSGLRPFPTALKAMVFGYSAVFLAFLFVVNTAIAQSYPWDKDPNLAETVSEWFKEVESVVRIRSDPVLRTIVCRVPYTKFTVDNLAKATGLAPITIAHGVSELVDKGLVRFDSGADGTVTIVPNGRSARETMRGWANDWCTSDDHCGVQQ